MSGNVKYQPREAYMLRIKLTTKKPENYNQKCRIKNVENLLKENISKQMLYLIDISDKFHLFMKYKLKIVEVIL